MRIPATALAIATLLLAPPVHADGVSMKEEKPGLLKKAKVSPDAATAAAQAKVPKGKVVSAEIEEENGKLIYSFDIKTRGKSGIDEVNVGASARSRDGALPYRMVAERAFRLSTKENGSCPTASLNR